jgi:hypothetical protein
VEVYSSLKYFCLAHPEFSYNTLTNYLSKSKIAFENDEVRVERKRVNESYHEALVPGRKMAMVANRARLHEHDEEKQNLEYWIIHTPSERLAAVTRLISATLPPGTRMDKTHIIKRKLQKTIQIE